MLTIFLPFSSFLQKYTHFLNFTYKRKRVIYDAKVYKNWKRGRKNSKTIEKRPYILIWRYFDFHDIYSNLKKNQNKHVFPYNE